MPSGPCSRPRREVDPGAIARYLVQQYVPAPLTAWQGVRKLLPGHLASWRGGRLEVRPYWSPPIREVAGRSTLAPEASTERVRELIRDAVGIRLESEVPLGVFLSGGLDSSVVVAEVAAARSRVASYSVGFKHAGFDETHYARLVADRFGAEHHELVADDDAPALFGELTRAYDEPFGDSSALATLAVAKAAREHVTVILTGDGGDELFGGYERYFAYRTARRLHRTLGPLAGIGSRALAAGGRVLRNTRLSGGAAWVREPWKGYRDALFHFAPRELGLVRASRGA